MTVYNQDKTQILETYDLELGRLQDDTITRHIDAVIEHHDAVAHVEEQGHYEVVAEYPNGGKDVKWVVDVEGVKGQEAYDETVTEARDVVEHIQIYIPYTETELAQMKAAKAISDNKAILNNTDYTVLKFMDSYIKANPTLLAEFEALYPNVLSSRASARDAINEAQESIGG